MTFTGGEYEKYLQFFEMVSGFICKKYLKTATNTLNALIEDEQPQLEAHLALKPKGDMASSYATDSGTEDADNIEEEKDNRFDGKKGDRSNEGKL